jgi:hypothetical protein
MFPILLELALDLRDAVVLGFLLATIMTKGDWPAYCEIAGVRQWLGSEGKLFLFISTCMLVTPFRFPRRSPSSNTLGANNTKVKNKRKDDDERRTKQMGGLGTWPFVRLNAWHVETDKNIVFILITLVS